MIEGETSFNESYDLAKYVGYMYDDGQGNQVNSTMKTFIDNWYVSNMTKYTIYQHSYVNIIISN